MHRNLMGTSSPDSVQIKIGKIFLNRLENQEENSLTTRELAEILQADGLNCTNRNLVNILHTYFFGIINSSDKSHKWTLAEDISLDDLKEHVEILENMSSNGHERL